MKGYWRIFNIGLSENIEVAEIKGKIGGDGKETDFCQNWIWNFDQRRKEGIMMQSVEEDVAALSWNQIGSFGAGFAKSKDDGLNRESKEQFSWLPTVSKITIECWRILSQRTVLDVVGGSDDVCEQLLSHVPDFSCWTK